MSVGPTEHLLHDLAYLCTKKKYFSLEVIRSCLQVALKCAEAANDSSQFKSELLIAASEAHNK